MSSLTAPAVSSNAMLIEEVDGVGLQAFERAFDDLLYVVGAAVGRGPFAVIHGIGLKAELGGNDDVFAERSEGFANDFFIDVRAIDLGRVEEGNAAFHGSADELDSFGLFRRRAEAEAQAHAAQAER